MTADSEKIPDFVRPPRGEKLLRLLHRCVPLGRHFHPLLAALNPPHGLFALPLESAHLLMPAAWRKSAAHLLLVGMDSVPEFRLLPPMLRELSEGCIVDVGANIGLYTVLFHAHSPLPIVSYEPQPFLCQMLRWNAAYNGHDQTRIRNVACGAEAGEVLMHAGLNGAVALAHETAAAKIAGRPGETWEQQAARAQAGYQWERVPVVTLDNELPQLGRVALLKVDCEGYELNILRGARRLLAQPGLRLFLEIHPSQLRKFGQSAAAVVDLLSPDFELEFWSFEQRRPKTKLGRSLARCRRPQAHRFASLTDFLAAVDLPDCASQMYCIGRPR